jgi:hypothetical protein
VLILYVSLIPFSINLSGLRFIALLLPLAFYSVAGTHDIHAISRAAFSAGNRLIRSGIEAKWIDGGIAFDGWTMYEKSLSEATRGARDSDGWWVQELAPAIRTRYVLSLSTTIEAPKPPGSHSKREVFSFPPLQDYHIYETATYHTYWPFAERTLFIMKEDIHEGLGVPDNAAQSYRSSPNYSGVPRID